MTISLNSRYEAAMDFKVIGYVGETNSRTIIFEGYETDGADCYKMRIEYPDGISYEVDITDGSYTVGGSVLREECRVKCQILALKADGEEYTLVKKSDVFTLNIKSSLDGEPAPIPTYEQSVGALDKMLAHEITSEKFAEAAAASAEEASSANAAAQTARTAAEESAVSASESKASVEAAAVRAEQAAQAASASEANVASNVDKAAASADNSGNSAKAAKSSAEAAAASAEEAIAANTSAQAARTAAEEYATAASESKASVEAAAQRAEQAAQAAGASEANVTSSADNAAASAESSGNSAKGAKSSAEAAAQSAETASFASTSAQAARTAAEEYATSASESKASVEAAAQRAEQAAQAASASEAIVTSSADKAAASAESSGNAAKEAKSSAEAAAQSAETASTASTAAQAARTAAEEYATSASESKASAETAATVAETALAAAEKTLNSIPEDYAELSNDVVELKSDFSGMGVMKRYTISGSDRIDIDGVTVPAGAEIYFRPVSAEEGKTGLILYGMYGDTNADGFDTLLNNAAFGKTYKLATSREYKKIRVVTYQFGGTEFAFDYLQTNSYGLQPDVSKLQSDVSELQSDVSKLITDNNRTLSLFCNTTITANGSNNIPVEKNKTYRFYVTDMVNVSSLNFYLFAEDNTNVSYGNLKNVRFVEITTNDTSAYVRIWTNKQDTTADLSYHVLAYVDTDGSLEHRVANAEKCISEYGLMSTFNRTTCKIFKRVVCCGDSYTSGYIQLSGETGVATNEEFAYPRYMSTLTGNEWINCGCSGCNVLTWQTHERGLPTAQAKGKAQAYVIGLMINDVSSSSSGVELGTIDDIGTDAQTYYGGMSAIIRELNAISPNAKIFVNTCPKTGEKYTTYNQAVRNIVNAYKETYPVHCIDLEAVKDFYNNSSLTNDFVSGHYTAIGYEQFAEIYAYVLSKYINEHVSDFQDVYRIEYDN